MSEAKRGRSAGRMQQRGEAAAGKTLVIVESGAKADTIGQFLGDDYVVSACFGHIRDLPRRAAERPAAIKGKPWADFAVDVDNGFEPHYIVPRESRSHITRLRKELKSADHVLLATDEDREGESIGWHLVEVLKPKVPHERIVFHEITRDAIEQALAEPRSLDLNLVEAQESRRILDRLYGYSLSPVLWRKLGQGTSAGRVQSVALRFLVERERERMAFVTAEYWGAEADFRVEQGVVRARLTALGGRQLASSSADFDAAGQLSEADKRHETRASLGAIAPFLEAADWRVSAIERRQASLRPRPPYTTSTLQQDASNRLGFAARRTMGAAQALYQGKDTGSERVGLITYMRTDSVTLSEQALEQADGFVRAQFGAAYAERRIYRTRSRNAQEAHEAIRPTDLARTPESLRGVLEADEYRLYDLIWRRTLASQMANARVERTSATFSSALPERPADDPAEMSASGQVVLFDGWYRVLPPRGGSGGGAVLPPLREGEPAALEALETSGRETQPPARYSEASLVRKLEEDGLGRPSTYAAVIGTLTQREYVSRKGQTLIPTFLGFAVTDLLTQHFADLVNAEFTAAMEDQLDQIANGETDSETHLSHFYFGPDGESGLKTRVQEKIATIPFWALELSEDGLRLTAPSNGGADPDRIEVRVRGGSAFLRRGAGEQSRTAPLPPDMAPADLSLSAATELLENAMQLPRLLGRHPEHEDDVWLMNGRFGPFVQIGETQRGRGAPKPRRASVPAGMELDAVTLEDAIEWLRFPKLLGAHPGSGEEVVVRPGRWGPYVQSGKERRNLKDTDDIETIDLERALALLAEPKRPRSGARGRRGAGARRR